VSRHSLGKFREVENILNEYQKIYGKESFRTPDGLIVLVSENTDFKILDLVNTTNRDEQKNFINSGKLKTDRTALDAIIAVGMFKEGTDWIYANRSIIVGTRSSLGEMIQMVGRLFRDVEGKEHVEVFHLLPFALDQNSEHFKENLNDYIKTFLASLILEDIISPITIDIPRDKKLHPAEKTVSKTTKPRLHELVQDASTLTSIMEEAVQFLAKEENQDPAIAYINFQEKFPHILEQQFNVDNDLSTTVTETLYMALIKPSLPIHGIDVRNIDISIIQGTHPLGGLLRFTSGACGPSTFQELRNAIEANHLVLSTPMIIDWIRQYLACHGKKPKQTSGVIEFAGSEYKNITWSAINAVLWKGGRGLPGGSSLAQLVEKEFGIKNRANIPLLTENKICEWIQQFIDKYKRKPIIADGVIEFALDEYAGETWGKINDSLMNGMRGMPKGSSLTKIIEKQFGIRGYCTPPNLSLDMIRNWIHQHITKHKKKPTVKNGIVEFAENEFKGISWASVANAMSKGTRGLAKGLSLAQFIQKEFGISNHYSLPPISVSIILQWINAFIKKYNRKPTQNDGIIEFARSEYKNITWHSVNFFLWKGGRGLPKGSSLAQFIEKKLGIRNRNIPPSFTEDQILDWIGQYFVKYKKKPTKTSGIVEFAERNYRGTTWSEIDSSFKRGKRGLHISSLAQFIQKKLDIKRRTHPPDLNLELILDWAQKYYSKYNIKPTAKNKVIEFAINDHQGETWLAVDAALRKGRRGLAGGSSLANLIHDKLGIKNHLKYQTDNMINN
jgi:hypothetical protein